MQSKKMQSTTLPTSSFKSVYTMREQGSLTNKYQVENELFKVPRRNFAVESEVFSHMFDLPVPSMGGHLPDGSGEDRPLRLEFIKKFDFIQLLRVMFPL
jgi:hypothetical protein